ncbi:formylglycine-generating enzyme family protein [Methylomonas rhizoryzae]|uniref:formylglycine-generating enzyme family protein n=1 Tax=Methylomonas rhizoryzae TaxID=2608981 RepID=UPI00123225B1|nr:formylglycine-generating enzyme family protein [Methylomonas rhizoryzae]
MLILDQFEEIFTLKQNQNHRQILAEQLGDLLSGQMPESLRNRLREGHKPDYSLRPPEVRVLISLREDSLGALQELATQIPGILSEVFRLTPLDLARARKAIVEPAALVVPGRFRSKPFSFQTTMVDALLAHMQDKRGNIEPFELQLLCRHVELQVVARQAESNESLEVDLQTYLGGEAGMDKVVNQFYRSAIGRLDSWHTRRKAKRLCETGLLNSEGRRESLSRNQIKHQFNLKDAVLKQLVESKVLRREERLDDYAYELSHDSLASTVFKARKAKTRLKGILTALPIILAVAVALALQMTKIENQDVRLNAALDEYKTQVREIVALDNPDDPKRRTIKEPAMTKVSAGRFMMGSQTGDSDERPPHPVTIAAFEIGIYEVTFDEYDQFAATELDRLPDDEGWGRGKRPVINVSWQEATDYAAWLSKKTGKHYRLPTEAEWEYAARAGTTGKYFWDAEEDPAHYAWFLENSKDPADGKNKTQPVGQRKPNPWGLYDTAGNVWEWVQDCYHQNYDGAPGGGSAWQPSSGGCERRALRGGSWGSYPSDLRSAIRDRGRPVAASYFTGFRLARTL